jgi:hypothetical protein
MTTTTETRYHVIDRNGEIVAKDLLLEHAADAVLSYDGARYEIRQLDAGHWTLMCARARDRHMVETVISSVCDTEQDAWIDIAAQVVAKDDRWFGCEAVPTDIWDEQYDFVRCECGEALGICCEWAGSASETVLVEYMPLHLRAAHIAAGNRGCWPANGAIRIRCERSCASHVIEDAGDWAFVCGTDNN